MSLRRQWDEPSLDRLAAKPQAHTSSMQAHLPLTVYALKAARPTLRLFRLLLETAVLYFILSALLSYRETDAAPWLHKRTVAHARRALRLHSAPLASG